MHKTHARDIVRGDLSGQWSWLAYYRMSTPKAAICIDHGLLYTGLLSSIGERFHQISWLHVYHNNNNNNVILVIVSMTMKIPLGHVISHRVD